MKQSRSPVIKKKDPLDDLKMDFPEAIKRVIDGKKITRLEWGDNKIFCHIDNDPDVSRDKVLLIMRNGENHQWIVSRADLLGKDWVVV